MSESDQPSPLAESSKQFVRRLLAMAGSRGELFVLEIEEERRHLLWTAALTLGAAVLVLLSGLALTAAIVIALWETHPIAMLLSLSAIYGCGAFLLGRRIAALRRDWKVLPATLDQLRKDGQCLEKLLN